MLAGAPTLRTPAGEQELRAWDACSSRTARTGAHKVTNRTDETVRVAIWSNQRDPDDVDLSRLGQGRQRGRPGKLFRIADAVDYWDGEADRATSSTTMSRGQSPRHG